MHSLSAPFRSPVVLLLGLLLGAAPSLAPAQDGDGVSIPRGWATLNPEGTTFVADNGELIRGPFASTEWSGPPTREAVAAVKTLGSNGIHLYAEVFDPDYPAAGSQAPGYAAEHIDALVQMTREEGLYLIITIGNGGNNGSFNLDYVLDFWDFYAPRYKDETHVIYEIQNEPHAWTPPYPTAARQMQVQAYDIIRGHAPDTPVLLFSYSVLSSGAAVLQDLAVIGDEIDWSNAGIAIHGYAGHRDTIEA
ncbi:MAG: cellulase family glycosylhydrolase, partial [Opitutales bacterium]